MSAEVLTVEEMLARMRVWCDRKALAMLPRDEVDDAVQVALMSVWDATKRLDGRPPWPLLTRAARQALSTYCREYYESRPEEYIDDHDEDQEEFAPVIRITSDRGDRPSFSPRMTAALDTLPARQREILVECVAEGRTKVAAASLLGVSDTRIRVGVETALGRLRKLAA
jgi:RNA polymerase sigma factor (sigma-70 family)